MTVLPFLLSLGMPPSSDIEHYLQPELHDATFTAHIVKADQRELAKVNHDFGTSYSFGTTTIHMKEPFMLRIDANVEDTSVNYIENGNTKVIRVPRAGIHTRIDLSMKPGQRQTAFDFGLLPPSLFEDFYQAKFVRDDRATGDPVFDVTYVPRLQDTSRSRIWVDPARHYITRREWYGQDGHQEATFYYTNPEHVDGVWLPTRLEVKNVDDLIAGVTSYESIKVNSGIADSEFETK